MSQYLVYALIDPVTLCVRYIGKSATGTRRVRSHRRVLADDQTHRARWIRALGAAGQTHMECVLEEFDSEHALNAGEVWWIAYGRLSRWPLTNMTAGGEGMSGHHQSEEQRAQAAARARRQWEDEKHRSRVSASSREYHSRPDVAARASARMSQYNQQPGVLTSTSSRMSEYHNQPDVLARMRGDENPTRRPEVQMKLRASWTDERRAAASARMKAHHRKRRGH